MEVPALPGAPRTWVLCPRHCDQADPGLLWRPRHGPGILPTKSDNTRAEKNAPQTHRLLKRCPKELPQSCQMEDRTRERNRNTPSGGRAPRGACPPWSMLSSERALHGACPSGQGQVCRVAGWLGRTVGPKPLAWPLWVKSRPSPAGRPWEGVWS